MDSYNTIKFEMVKPRIGMLTLNRPEKLNAVSVEVLEEIHKLLNELKNELNGREECRVIIVTGAGRAFSSGADLSDTLTDAEARRKDLSKVSDFFAMQKYFANMIALMRDIPQPLIAATRGPAVGGGFCMAMACDIRIAGESTKFCSQFINMGASGCDMGSSYLLPRLVGVSRAYDIIYTGRWVYAEEAERIGLVSRVVPDDSVLSSALEVAETLVSKSFLGLKFTKEGLNINIDAPSLSAALALENRNQILCAITEGIDRKIKKG